jgi:lipopolysaccharide transport system ATP-binding protein
VSDVIIRASDLRKVYRLYSKPSYRFRDMFGLLGAKAGAYTEHAALDGINLEIRRGEKVAIIGRNGAGKSTFLKLVTNVIAPTSGRLEVSGQMQALLQIGTGFHPDFTGRENVYAYFAQLGIVGEEAQRKCEETIEFAELEEYIDQPIKTYSTGMGVRLMFSASTAITPELLVLDEVLGVGDAYFSQKSFDRMRELCDRNGTTLLLVTHDIYSAVKMCGRVIWFDAGTVMMDGDGTTVVKAYEESIRLQEERRLRRKKQAQLAAAAESAPRGGDVAHLLVEVQGRNGRHQPCPVYFSGIQLMRQDEIVAALPLGPDAFDSARGSHLVLDGGCWGDVIPWHERLARPMLNYGSSFHKVVGVLAVPNRALTGALQLVVDYWCDQPVDVVVRCYAGGGVLDLGALPAAEGRWMRYVAPYTPEAFRPSAALALVAPGIQGAGNIVIESVELLNASGGEICTVTHGEPVRFRIGYRIAKKRLRERAQVFIIVSRDTTNRICKFMTSDLLFDEEAAPCGVVEMSLSSMMLGAGTYSVAVEIAADGYSERGMTRFFSVDPDVYHCLTHALEFTVTNSGWMGDGTVFEGHGNWTIGPRVV